MKTHWKSIFKINIQNKLHSQVRDIIEQRGHKIPDPDLEINIPGSKGNAPIRSHTDTTFVVVSKPRGDIFEVVDGVSGHVFQESLEQYRIAVLWPIMANHRGDLASPKGQT